MLSGSAKAIKQTFLGVLAPRGRAPSLQQPQPRAPSPAAGAGAGPALERINALGGSQGTDSPAQEELSGLSHTGHCCPSLEGAAAPGILLRDTATGERVLHTHPRHRTRPACRDPAKINQKKTTHSCSPASPAQAAVPTLPQPCSI